jgi:hypothetical protein
MGGLISTLVSLGIPAMPGIVPLVLASLTCLLLCSWLATQTRTRKRRSRAQEAIAAKASPEVVLAAAGFAGWAAFTTIDGDEVLDAPRHDVPATELREVQSWLRLGAPEPLKRLSTGTWVVRSRQVRHDRRLVVGLQRRPEVYELDLAHWLVESILDGFQPRQAVTVNRFEGERALGLVELQAFDRLRRGAGQLVAERVIAETERRLRSVLRANDAVVRLGDDVFAVSMVIGNNGVEALESRIREAVSTVPVPQRLEELRPRVVVARARDAHRIPELAAVEERLLPLAVAT